MHVQVNFPLLAFDFRDHDQNVGKTLGHKYDIICPLLYKYGVLCKTFYNLRHFSSVMGYHKMRIEFLVKLKENPDVFADFSYFWPKVFQ